MGNDLSHIDENSEELIRQLPDNFSIDRSGVINEGIIKLINIDEKLDMVSREEYMTAMKNEARTITLDSTTIEVLNNSLQRIQALKKEILRIERGGKPTEEEIQHAVTSISNKYNENKENNQRYISDETATLSLEKKLSELMNQKQEIGNKNKILKTAISKIVSGQ